MPKTVKHFSWANSFQTVNAIKQFLDAPISLRKRSLYSGNINNFTSILALPVPIPNEEKGLKALKGLHKTFRGTTKKCENKNLIFISIQLSEMNRTGTGVKHI